MKHPPEDESEHIFRRNYDENILTPTESSSSRTDLMNRNESFFQLFSLHFVDDKQKQRQRRAKKAGVREIFSHLEVET